MANNGNNDKSLESWIWDAACSIRGAKDAPKYKEFILPLIFAKRLCDVFDDELNRIAKEVGSRAKAFKLVKHDKKLVRFFLPLEPKNPDDPVWSIIRKLADKIGEQLTTLLRDIADENSLLKGIIDRVDTKLAKSKLRTGDVLVVRTGYPGTACVVPEYDDSNCIDLVIVRPNAEVVRSGFLSRFFNAPAGKSQAVASKHGLAQQHLNVSAVKRTLVPVPSLEEQDEIDSTLAAVQQKITLISAKKETLTDLFHTLLHQLMTARIRVHNVDLPELKTLTI
jgi:HsdM N-terminal domain/Type I restriction modification DNA specificity domain